MKTIVALIIAILVIAFLVNAMKKSTLFFPDRYPEGDWDVARLEIQPQDHFIETPDAVRLHAWHFAVPDSAAPLMIWFHGNGGNLTHRADFAVELARRGVSVLLFDYRGYGKSEGRPTEGGLYVDALAVHDYATRRLGLTPDRIVA
ncbi:MAG TPA: alpha/beta hydrolase, partial [Thermoanaerobaculia bacterium]